jgi:hypothetical protein
MHRTTKIILSAIEAAEHSDKQAHYRSVGFLNSNNQLTFIPIGKNTFEHWTLTEVRNFKEEASRKFALVWTDEYQQSRKTKGFVIKTTLAYVKSLCRKDMNARTRAKKEAPTFNRQILSSLPIEKQRSFDAGNGEFVKRAMSHRAISSYQGAQKQALQIGKAFGVMPKAAREYQGQGRTHTAASNLKTEIKRGLLKAGNYLDYDFYCSHLRENLKRLPTKSTYIEELISTPDTYTKLLNDSRSSLSRDELKQIIVEIQNAKSDHHISGLDKKSGYILSSLVPEFISFCREIKGDVDNQYGFCSKKETEIQHWIKQRVWELGCAVKDEYDGALISLGDVPQNKIESILDEAEKVFRIFIKRNVFC